MKLFWSARSPFVRKVMILAHELDLAARIETVPATVGSALLMPEVMAVSPANRIPALFDIAGAPGLTVIGSGSVCHYLEEMVAGPTAADWPRLALEAVGDGIMDNNVLRLGDLNRPAGMVSDKHLAAYRAKTASALDWLEPRAEELRNGRLGAAEAATIAALTHLDFRFAEDAWRDGHPALAAWFDSCAERPSVLATAYA